MEINIRQENVSDYRVVEELTREAFWNIYVPGCNEHFMVHKLRKCPDYIAELDMVAEIDRRIVGHIIYTRGTIKDSQGADHRVICFGPVSVLPDLQKQGIGGALIRHTLKAAAAMGFTAVLIYGDPRYYSRFGFRCAEKYDIQTADGKYAIALLALELLPGALKNMAGRFNESPTYAVDEAEFDQYEKSFPYKEKVETESQAEFRIMASLRY